MGQTRVRKSKKAEKDAHSSEQTLVTKTGQLNLSSAEFGTSNSSSTSISAVGMNNFSKPPCNTPGVEVKDKDPDQQAPFIEVRDTETKGQAIFSTRKIQPGTLILSETATVRLTQAQEDEDKLVPSLEEPTHLQSAVDNLPRPIQKSYLKLFDSKKTNFTQVKSIYYSNCYNLSGGNRPSKSSPGGSCIGLLSSRINHSCIPNVQFSYDEVLNRMLFHAVKPIPKGREITSTYDSIYEVRAQRQKRQSLYYAFRCDCDACTGPTEFWAKSDERRRGMIEARREMKECEKVFGEVGMVGSGNDPTHALERLEGLMIKEGILNLSLGDVYKDLAKWAERKENEKMVRKWREKELDVCRICLGETSVRTGALRLKLGRTH